MKRQIGKRVYTVGKSYWTKRKWGTIVAIGDSNHYIVKYKDGRKAWIKKEQILFWK